MADFATNLPIIGGFFDDSDEQILALLEEQRRRAQAQQTPEFGQYVPEEYSYQTISEDPRLRESQMLYLQKLQGLSESGLSPQDLAVFEEAKRQSNQIARAREGAILENAAARGIAGSGLEFMAREQSAQDAAERARASGMAQAAEAAKQKAMYTQAYGGALSGQRSQDFGINQANTDIINRFNQANVDLRNQAFQYNQNNQQRAYENELRRLGLLSGADESLGRGYAAESALAAGNRRALGSALGAGIGMMAAGPAGAQAGAQQGGATAGGGSTDAYNYAQLGSMIGGGY